MSQPAPTSMSTSTAAPAAGPVAPAELAPAPSLWFTLHRWAWFALAVFAAFMAAGCATPRQIRPDAVSYGSWPPDRAPGTYAFERLPSQEADQGERRDRLEAAASAALQRAGFKPAESAETADVLVLASARYIRVAPYDYFWGPYWYGSPRVYLMGGRVHGYRGYHRHHRVPYFVHGYGYWGFPRAWGPMPTQILEASLVLRDRKTQKIIHEARARYDFPWNNDAKLVEALFDAALKDFPTPRSRRTVVVPIPPRDGSDEGDDAGPAQPAGSAAAPAADGSVAPPAAPAAPAEPTAPAEPASAPGS